MKNKRINAALKALTAVLLLISLALTFTVSDYYIFNRIYEYGVIFPLSQWVKKSALLLFPLAIYFNKKSCADIAKYLLPVFTVVSCFTYGKFFDISMINGSADAEQVYAHINEFMPRQLTIALFYASNALILAVCVLLFIRDGFKTRAKSWRFLPLAISAVMPLNIFENFFDIAKIPQNSFMRFNSFTVWHFVALAGLIGFTVAFYYYLKTKGESAHGYLAAAAIILLIQYHSKDSVVMGDGYNVYRTVFACIPLFICNIGVYVAAFSVMLKKRVLYAISFFIHAAGALSVFVYFGRPEISNYGIFCSYSILYFMLTHCLLFALSVVPTALGHYKFRPKDCAVPLLYYFAVIIIASVASALVTSASMAFEYNGYELQTPGEWLYPNYAFTQINPLPFELPPLLTLKIWRYEVNVLYVLGLYAAYVAIFYVFNGGYYGFKAIRKRILYRKQHAAVQEAEADAAATEQAPQQEEDLK